MAWPTTDNPRTVFVTLRLSKSENDDLTALAAAMGVTRSVAVRAAIETASRLAIIEAANAVPDSDAQ